MSLENLFSFVIGAFIFFFVGAIIGETTTFNKVESTKVQYKEEGYTKAYTDHMGQDVGVPFAKCKLSGGEPIVNGNRVACLKEMKND